MFSYRYFTIITLLLLIGLGFYVYDWEYREPVFEVNFFSLNRGRAIFIRSPENKTILIGGGQNSEVIRELTKVMPFYNKHIDYIVIPSATPAQIGGLIEILDRYDVEQIIQGKYMATSTVLSLLEKKIRKKKIHVEEVESGDEIEIGSLKIKIFFPNKDFKYNKTSLPELALQVEYKNTAVFLMGSLSKTIQKNIARDFATSTTSNLLEYYHSGIDSRVSDLLIDKIQPEFMFTTKERSLEWISDGEEWVK
jgi:competence protein ComEC